MNYKNYREGKLDAYQDALLIVSVMMDVHKTEDAQNALKRIQERLERNVAWNKEELERLENQQ